MRPDLHLATPASDPKCAFYIAGGTATLLEEFLIKIENLTAAGVQARPLGVGQGGGAAGDAVLAVKKRARSLKGISCARHVHDWLSYCITRCLAISIVCLESKVCPAAFKSHEAICPEVCSRLTACSSHVHRLSCVINIWQSCLRFSLMAA